MTLRLSPAIRPAPGVSWTLEEGYRISTYRNRLAGLEIPALALAASRDRLFDAFLALLEPLGEVVDVVLETSHGQRGDRHQDLRRLNVDRPVLSSYLCEFEDLLVDDGCTGVAVMASDRPMEVQFDEHKSLIVYAHNLKPFRRVVKSLGFSQCPGLKLLSEEPHQHFSPFDALPRFRELAMRIGACSIEGVGSLE